VVSNKEIQCEIPYANGTGNVVTIVPVEASNITGPTFDFTCNPCDFTAIYRVSEINGCVGTVAFITGIGFLCDTIQDVTVGGISCNRYSVLSDSIITCAIPDGNGFLNGTKIIRTSPNKNVTKATSFEYSLNCTSASCSAYTDQSSCDLAFGQFPGTVTLRLNNTGENETLSLVVRTIVTDDSVPKETLIGTVFEFDSRLFHQDSNGDTVQVDTHGNINFFEIFFGSAPTRTLDFTSITVMYLDPAQNKWIPASLTCSNVTIPTYQLPTTVPLCALGIFYVSFGIIDHPDIDVLDIGVHVPSDGYQVVVNNASHTYTMVNFADLSIFNNQLTTQVTSPLYGNISISAPLAGIPPNQTFSPPSTPFNTTWSIGTTATQEIVIHFPPDTGAFYFFLQPSQETLWEFDIYTTCETVLSFPFNQPISYATGLVIWAKHIAAALDRVHIKGNTTGGIQIGYFAIAPAIFDTTRSFLESDGFFYLTTPNTDFIFYLQLRDWYNNTVDGALSHILEKDERVVSFKVVGGPRPSDDYSCRVRPQNETNPGEYPMKVLPKGPGQYNVSVNARCNKLSISSHTLVVGCDLGPANDTSLRYYCYVDYYNTFWRETLPEHKHTDIVPATIWTRSWLNIEYFDCDCNPQQYVPFPFDDQPNEGK